MTEPHWTFQIVEPATVRVIASAPKTDRAALRNALRDALRFLEELDRADADTDARANADTANVVEFPGGWRG